MKEYHLQNVKIDEQFENHVYNQTFSKESQLFWNVTALLPHACEVARHIISLFSRIINNSDMQYTLTHSIWFFFSIEKSLSRFKMWENIFSYLF